MKGAAGFLGPFAKMITGAVQRRKGKQLMKEAGPRPEYNTPDAVMEALGFLNANLYDGGLPGQAALLEQLNTQTANTMNSVNASAMSSTDALAALVGADEMTKAAQTDFFVKGRQQDLTDQNNMANFLANTLSNYQDKEWEYNEYTPWRDKMRAAEAMMGAAQRNLPSAASEMGEVGSGMASYFSKLGVYNDWKQTMSEYFDESLSSAGGKFSGFDIGGNTDLTPDMNIFDEMASSFGLDFDEFKINPDVFR